MALHIKTIKGHEYVYDVKSYRDRETKKVKKITTYMGRLANEATKEYLPKKKTLIPSSEDRQILNYGDTYLLSESLKTSKLGKLFDNILPKDQDTLKALVCYKIIEGEAHKNASVWFEGNYAKAAFPGAALDSQRISEFLTSPGNEKVQRGFFKEYMTNTLETSSDVVVDSTGMPNEIHIPLTEYGGHGGDIQKETRLIMVIDRITHMPLYFRLVAGNIVDVSTLTTTFTLMSKYGVNPQMLLMDAGYYSEKNIRFLFKSKISFLTRLPAGRKLYKDLIEQNHSNLETPENACVYNKRSLFVEKIKIEIFGYKGFAYVCSDVKQRGLKMDRFIKDAKEDNLSGAEIAEKMPFVGRFVLVSDKDIDITELLPLYYTRQIAENTFGFAKANLNLLPVRVHSMENLKGYIFLSYLALLLSVEINQKLKGLYSLQDALSIGHNLFCEVWDGDVIPLEPNKKLKEIYDKLNIVVVNSSGE